MSHFFRIATLFLIAGAVPMMAQPGRIPGRIDASRRTMLRGQTHPKALPEFDQGPLDPSTRLSPLFFLLKRTPAQQAGIERLLATSATLARSLDREVKKLPLLRGRSVFNLFFENSTRTRTTFEIAAARLSARW